MKRFGPAGIRPIIRGPTLRVWLEDWTQAPRWAAARFFLEECGTVERAELIRRYREGPEVLEAAVAGLGDTELDRRPEDGGWTAREVVHHVADSEMTSAIRLRRLLAEQDPLIQGYDEVQFARRLHYSERPIQPSLAAIRAARETTASVLEHMTEPDWRRRGTHTESGEYSVEDWLATYSAHCHDHAEQVRRAVEERPSKAG